MAIPTHARWPAIVIGALALHAIAWLAVVYLATSNPSYAVEDDYYAKALEWDATRDQNRRNEALGWHLDLAVVPGEGSAGDAEVRVTLSDRDGTAVERAIVAVEAFHNARAGDVLHGRLEPLGAGRYAAAMPLGRNGLWELRVTVDRDGDRFTHREVRHLRVGPGAGRPR